jgi:hypothetical protein
MDGRRRVVPPASRHGTVQSPACNVRGLVCVRQAALCEKDAKRSTPKSRISGEYLMVLATLSQLPS